jgi:hypothetical protein
MKNTYNYVRLLYLGGHKSLLMLVFGAFVTYCYKRKIIQKARWCIPPKAGACA